MCTTKITLPSGRVVRTTSKRRYVLVGDFDRPHVMDSASDPKRLRQAKNRKPYAVRQQVHIYDTETGEVVK